MRRTIEVAMPKMRMLAVVVGLLITTPVSAADKNGEWFTMQLLNGRGWMNLTDETRQLYVTGLINGLRWAWLEQGKLTLELWENIYIPRLSMSETRKGLDLFYADPANVNVPVVFALQIFKMRLDGKPQAEIDKQTEEVRTFAHDVIEDSDRVKQ